MKDNIFDKLFELRKKEDDLQLVIKAIDDTKAPHIEKLNILREQLSEVKNSILEGMEKENIKTYSYGLNNVIASVRKTLGISNEPILIETIEHSAARIGRSIGMTVKEVKAKSFVKALNKPFVKEIADSYYKVNGKLLEGTEIIETKYLTVK